MQKQEMTNTKAIKQAIGKGLVEMARAEVLTINGEGRREIINFEQNGAPEAKRHRMGTSLRPPVFN